MDTIDDLEIDHVGSDVRKMILGSGSIDSIPEGIEPDYVAIWCRPGNYDPAQEGLIRTLAEMGISVEDEALLPEIDFRPTLPCWVSRDLSSVDVRFKRLLVWEPDTPELNGSLLGQLALAFQALDRTAGKRGASFLLLPLWTGMDNDSLEDILRMQFYSAAALAARAAWQTIYMLVEVDDIDEMADLFANMKKDYQNPPVTIPELISPFIRFGIPTKISEVKLSRQLKTGEVPWPGLTERQHTAIFSYTQLAYLYVNRALRLQDLKAPEFIGMQAFIEALSSGLAALPNYMSEDRVRRTIRVFDGIDKLYVDGQLSHEFSFTSTTARPQGAVFGSYQLFIRSILGKDIVGVSSFPEEEEVLFDYSMRHLVTDKREGPEPSSMQVTSDEGIEHSLGLSFSHL
jgi:hypothetical protein